MSDHLPLWNVAPDPPRHGRGGPIAIIVQAADPEGVLAVLREIPNATYLLPSAAAEADWLDTHVTPIPAKDGPAVLAVVRMEAE